MITHFGRHRRQFKFLNIQSQIHHYPKIIHKPFMRIEQVKMKNDLVTADMLYDVTIG